MPNDSNPSNAHIAYRLGLIEPKVTKIYEDMYEGDGPEHPSMTMRMDRQERQMEERQKRDDRTYGYMMAAFLLILATFLTLIGNLVSNAFKH
jgi:hypothetical protein